MQDFDRRSAFALGLTAAASTALLTTPPSPAVAQTYGPTEGRELGPGVRLVDLGQRASVLPAYKTLRMRDVIVQPGASTPEREMMNDMLCHMTEGELAVVQNDQRFTVKKGDVWACAKGISTEGTHNAGSTVAVMRIIDLLA
jgi:quercetin dioxygenase-like cupin family protein